MKIFLSGKLKRHPFTAAINLQIQLRVFFRGKQLKMGIVGIICIVFLVVTQAKGRSVPGAASGGRNGEFELIDLTHPFDENTLGFPGLKHFQLNITDRGITKAGFWLQTEDYGGSTHSGTHMDAPCHIMEGQWSLEQIPLYHMIAPAAVVDISERADKDRNTNLEVKDLIDWEKRNKKTLNGSIVLVNSGWSKRWSNKTAFLGTDTGDVSKVSFPGVSEDAAEWISKNRKIYGLGIDTTSLDNGRAVQRRAHEALFRANIYGMENVAHLERLPEYGALVYVFPMRIGKACGAPVRIIALIPKEAMKS